MGDFKFSVGLTMNVERRKLGIEPKTTDIVKIPRFFEGGGRIHCIQRAKLEELEDWESIKHVFRECEMFDQKMLSHIAKMQFELAEGTRKFKEKLLFEIYEHELDKERNRKEHGYSFVFK